MLVLLIKLAKPSKISKTTLDLVAVLGQRVRTAQGGWCCHRCNDLGGSHDAGFRGTGEVPAFEQTILYMPIGPGDQNKSNIVSKWIWKRADQPTMLRTFWIKELLK